MFPLLGGTASTETTCKSVQIRLLLPFTVYLRANSLTLNFG